MNLDDKQKIYELAFLVNPSLSEDELSNLINKAKNWVKEAGCEIIKEGATQKRKLGYSVKKFQSAFLVSLFIKGSPSTPEILNKKIAIENNILRHLFVNYTQKELDQLEQTSKVIKIRKAPTLSSSTQTATPSTHTKEAELKEKEEEVMDKESLKEIDKRLEEILSKSL
jgi:small subunit ribosomal protein S6